MLNDDSYVVANNLPLVRRAGEGVLANDSDANGGLHIPDPDAFSTTEGGIIYIESDGSFAYLAKDGFFGTDTFEYMAENAIGGQASATITFEVVAAANQPAIRMADNSMTGAVLAPGQAEIPLSEDFAAGVPVALSGGGYVVAASTSGGEAFSLVQTYGADGNPVGGLFKIQADNGVPAVSVVATDDGFLAAWREGGMDSDEWPVKLQVFDQAGSPVGTTIELFAGATLSSVPGLLKLADGNLAVTIQEQGVGTAAQIVTPDGDPIGAKFTLVGPPADARPIGQIADDLGGFFQLWREDGVDGSSLWVQRLEADGTPIGPRIDVVEGLQDNLAASLAMADDGGLVVTWTDFDDKPSVANLHARVFTDDGTPVGTEFVSSDFFWGTVFGPPVMQRAYALTDGFVVAWEHDIEPFSENALNLGGVTGARRAISAMVFDAEGNIVSDEVLVYSVESLTPLGSARLPPFVTPLANGGFAIAAQEYDRDGVDMNVVLHSFDQFGNRIGNEALINGSAAEYQLRPSLALLADGRVVGVWTGGTEVDLHIGSQIIDIVDVIAREEDQGPITLPISVDVIESLGGTSPDSAVRIVIEGLPDGALLTPPPGMTATFDAGSGLWTLTGTIPDSFDLRLDLPKYYWGDITLLATVYARDDDGGAETASTPLAIRLEIAPDAAVIIGTPGKDTVNGTVSVAGQDFAGPLGDEIYGLAGRDVLSGLEGDDLIDGGSGGDTLDGGAGDDTMVGGRGRDTLLGGDDDDILSGGRGRDTLDAGPGNDRLDGGKGRDLLTGGEGVDTFVFANPGKPDKVTDFAEGDIVALKGAKFGGIGPLGALQAAYFHAGGEAETKQQKILYDRSSGWLLYAEKGSETASPVRFARIGKDLADFDAGDMMLI